MENNGANDENGDAGSVILEIDPALDVLVDHKAMSAKRPESRVWVFTINNYRNEERALMAQMFLPFATQWIMGKEVGKKGTPHIQGFVKFDKKKRLTWVKKKIHKTCYWAICRSPECAIPYCAKDGDYKTFGIGDYIIRKELVNHYNGEDLPRRAEFYPWQEKAYNFLMKKSPRDVYWIFEEIGNCGKSMFSKYMMYHENAMVVQKGKYADIMNIAFNKGPSLSKFIIDVPRSSGNNVSYTAIETIKNGMIINTKYETGQSTVNPVSIMVFSNFPPDISDKSLSKDRWKIYEIVEKDLVQREPRDLVDWTPKDEIDLLEQNA